MSRRAPDHWWFSFTFPQDVRDYYTVVDDVIVELLVFSRLVNHSFATRGLSSSVIDRSSLMSFQTIYVLTPARLERYVTMNPLSSMATWERLFVYKPRQWHNS